MSFGPNVGITFRELMSGYVAPGAVSPEQGALSGMGKDSNFSFDLAVHIPKLRDFLNGAVHQAEIRGGVMEWKGHTAKRTARAGWWHHRHVSQRGRRRSAQARSTSTSASRVRTGSSSRSPRRSG